METISDYMTRQHGECDALFADAENAANTSAELAAEGFGRFRRETERHFELEEQVLFPELEGRTGMSAGPTQVMRMEHEQMRALLADMAQALADGDGEEYLGLSETMLILMQQHNVKEQTVLYPLMDRVLGADTDALLKRLDQWGSNTSGSLP